VMGSDDEFRRLDGASAGLNAGWAAEQSRAVGVSSWHLVAIHDMDIDLSHIAP